MHYAKPYLPIVSSAIININGNLKIGLFRDLAPPHPFNATPAAYEPDE